MELRLDIDPPLPAPQYTIAGEFVPIEGLQGEWHKLTFTFRHVPGVQQLEKVDLVGVLWTLSIMSTADEEAALLLKRLQHTCQLLKLRAALWLLH